MNSSSFQFKKNITIIYINMYIFIIKFKFNWYLAVLIIELNYHGYYNMKRFINNIVY